MMTLAEKQKRIELYHKAHIEQKRGCEGCLLVHFPNYEPCWEDVKFIERNYKILFGDEPTTEDSNPYWERICRLSERQRAKGMETYGQGLENNPAEILERIEHLQEELIDGLMYCEWLKDKIAK
ncbi:MAG: hypothetical protein IIV14_00775 [Bacteroidaceae bacterium]|nr:hypothetical protein [Bacteroidaceae bacterium]